MTDENWVRPRLANLHFSSLTHEEADSLEADFTEEEVKGAVDALGGDKSSGPDGFPISFFHIFWETIRLDMLLFIKEFHSCA
ncbi:hypothetical protein PJI17_32105, partial [Mycobacterium kansasii]